MLAAPFGQSTSKQVQRLSELQKFQETKLFSTRTFEENIVLARVSDKIVLGPLANALICHLS